MAHLSPDQQLSDISGRVRSALRAAGLPRDAECVVAVALPGAGATMETNVDMDRARTILSHCADPDNVLGVDFVRAS